MFFHIKIGFLKIIGKDSKKTLSILIFISFFQKKCFVYQNILYLCIQK